jgi:hypothetical protein
MPPLQQSFEPANQEQPKNTFEDMHNRANLEGIRLKTAGTMQNQTNIQRETSRRENATTFFNKGFTLFKAAMVIFAFILAEALTVFFLRDAIGVSALYPAAPFAIGFSFFIVCSILYACGYRSQERKTKNNSYIITSVIIFVITVIATSMVAIYFKANLADAKELLKFVVLPVVFLFNIVLYAIFYHLFTRHSTNDR